MQQSKRWNKADADLGQLEAKGGGKEWGTGKRPIRERREEEGKRKWKSRSEWSRMHSRE